MTNHSHSVARDMLNQVRVLSATPTLCRDHDPPASNPDSGPNLKSNSCAVLFQLTFHGPPTPPSAITKSERRRLQYCCIHLSPSPQMSFL